MCSNFFVEKCLVWAKGVTGVNFTDEEISLYVDLVIDPYPKYDFDFIYKHESIIDFNQISSNTNLNWTIDLLNKYGDKIYWEVFLRCNNQYWNDIEFLSNFKNEIKVVKIGLKWRILKQLISNLNDSSIIEILKNPKLY